MLRPETGLTASHPLSGSCGEGPPSKATSVRFVPGVSTFSGRRPSGACGILGKASAGPELFSEDVLLRPETGPTASHPLSGSCGEEASSRLAKSAEPNRPAKTFGVPCPSASAIIASGIGSSVAGSCPSGAAGRSLFCWRSFIPFHYTPLAGEMQSCRPLFLKNKSFQLLPERKGPGRGGRNQPKREGEGRKSAFGPAEGLARGTLQSLFSSLQCAIS